MQKEINSNSQVKYFPALTGMRAIAAYMVFLHHLNPLKKDYFGSNAFNFLNELNIGVTVFFVLSGFVIANKYFDINIGNINTYFVKRFARIYPMYFMVTLMTFMVSFVYLHPVNILNTFFLNITFLKGFFNDLKFSGISQGWSLTVEVTFYCLAPIFFMLCRNRKYFLIYMPIFLIIMGILLVTYCRDALPFGFFHSYSFMFNFTFFGRSFEFFVGIALAIMIKRNYFNLNYKYLTFAGILIIVAIICTTLSLCNKYSDLNDQQMIRAISYMFFLPLFGISILFVGIIRERTLISRLLENKLMLLLGKSSYVFYLIHLGIFTDLIYKYSHNYFVIFLTINLISIFMYKYIEQPINISLQNIFLKNKH